MVGTPAGGAKARKTNYKRYGKNFYKDIGRKGGSVSGTRGGFAYGDNAKKFGETGGKHSRRGYKLLKKCDEFGIYLNKATNKKVKIIW